jgi:hypothetical protein
MNKSSQILYSMTAGFDTIVVTYSKEKEELAPKQALISTIQCLVGLVFLAMQSVVFILRCSAVITIIIDYLLSDSSSLELVDPINPSI